jgi:hypothetical protein
VATEVTVANIGVGGFGVEKPHIGVKVAVGMNVGVTRTAKPTAAINRIPTKIRAMFFFLSISSS